MIDVCRTFNYKGTKFVEVGFSNCCISIGSNLQPDFESDVVALKAPIYLELWEPFDFGIKSSRPGQ
jgi:hypothetical protein